ncbi:ROK family transcriptional regulator, partial [bacterium]|nr:ROK family transcriptional regulator [bacterium]
MDRALVTQARLLSEMIRHGLKTRGEVARQSGMTKASISRLMDELLQAGLVFEGQKLRNSKPGRRARLLTVRSDLAHFVGADLEGMAVRACVVNSALEVVASARHNVDPRWPTGKIMQEWAALITDVVRNSGVPPAEIAGMGLGLPGLFNRQYQTVHAYFPPG